MLRIAGVLVFCMLCRVEGLLLTRLSLQNEQVIITASSTCEDGEQYNSCSSVAEDECLRTCGNSGIPHGPELAVDGDRNTSWQSHTAAYYASRAAVSNGGGILVGDLPAQDLIIDLGQVVNVVEVRVWSGDTALPSMTSLYGSLDGEAFSQLSSSSSSSSSGQDIVVLPVVSVTDQQEDLTTDQKEDTLVQFLRIELEPPLESLATSDLRSVFFSVSEVEIFGICPSPSLSNLQCYGDPIVRRTLVYLENADSHRLLWQRSNQSEVWILDDVILTVDECPVVEEECQFNRVKEDFNDSINSLVWESTSFSSSSIIGPFSCSDSPSLLVPPGDQIITRPLIEGTTAIQFGVVFPYPSSLCRDERVRYSPVEVRQCRSIAGVLGDCELIALVSISECGNCVDKLTFELRHMQEELDSASFPANITILSVLHDDIHSTLDDLEEMEGIMIVLEVAVGILSAVPPSSLPLPSSIRRYDLQLVPSVIEKLEILRNLLNQIPIIDVILRDDLIQFYDDVMMRLDSVLNEANQLQYRQRRLASDVATLVRSLSEEREVVFSARQTVIEITELLFSRQYSDIIINTSSLSDVVSSLLDMTHRFIEQTQNNTLIAQNLSSSLMEVSIPLQSAGILIAETLGITREAFSLFDEALTIDGNLTVLLQEAEEGVIEAQQSLSSGEDAVINGGQLLIEARNDLQNATEEIPVINVLIDQLNQTIQSPDSSNFNHLLMSSCSTGQTNCTFGEEHAALLAINLTTIVNSSVSIYTRRLAADTLNSIGNEGKPLDLPIINETALLAQDEARKAISLLVGLDDTVGGVASSLLISAQLLLETSQNISISSDLLEAVSSTDQRVEEISLNINEYRGNLNQLVERIASQEEIGEEAAELASRVNVSRETVREIGERVENVRLGVQDVSDDIAEISTTVQATEMTLQNVQQTFPLVSRVLEATQRSSEAAISNITNFLRENQRIVADIDSLIDRLSDIHANIALINSPVRLSSQPSSAVNTTIPYLSLQPPSGRQLEGGVQFEDIDLYLWSSAQYQSPTLIFYAGPVLYPHQNQSEEVEEDLVWVIAEDDQLRLGWELGSYHGNTTYPALLEGDSKLRLTRIGSRFQLEFSPSSSPPLQTSSSLMNNSLLFHSSSRTAFLLGGWPLGSKLGSEVRPLPLESLRGFEGQFQLALFNGGPWSLWGVRSTSPTDLIGDQEFRRNDLSRGVTWHATTGRTRTTSVLSFDGVGYLFTQQFGTETSFTSFFQTITIYLRPNDASRGLVMYAFQTEISLSLEVAFRDGQLNVLISLHSGPSPEVLVNYTEVVSLSGNGEMEVGIRYVPLNRRYTINGRSYDLPASSARFFTDLRQVKAWFGGFRDGVFEESSYSPQMRSGYFGCVDMEVQRVFTIFEVFRGESFTKYYLNSPYQSRLSATCYSTVYVREVSFAAEGEGLEYTYLPLPPLSSTCTPTLPLSLSISLLPLHQDGVILAARDQESNVLVRLLDGRVTTTVSVGDSSLTLSSQISLDIGLWHYLFISLTSSQELQLFVDGVLHATMPFTLTGFSLNLPISNPVGVVNPLPILSIGRISNNFSLPSFIGCMRDVTFDLCPLTFHSQSLVEQYPAGVSYHSCPVSLPSDVPVLPVQPEPPQQRLCQGVGPVELDSTHGGFTRDTVLETSNVAGLLAREWSLTFALRQRRGGHVMTVREISGAMVTVELEGGGRLALSLTSATGGIDKASLSTPFPFDIFTPVNVRCSVESLMLYCNMTTEDDMESVIVEIPHNSSIFDPALPISLGMTNNLLQPNMEEGFEGCISDLAINGNTAGFKGVETDTPCYNETVTGLGFTGISSIREILPPPMESGGEMTVAVTVKPQLETGVVLVLTTVNTTQPVILVQLVQGQLQVSQDGREVTVLSEDLCNSTTEVGFEVLVNYTVSQLSVSLTGGSAVTYTPLPPPLVQYTDMELTIGHLPGDVDAPGLVGCVLSLSSQGQPLNLSSAVYTNILNGICPDN